MLFLLNQVLVTLFIFLVFYVFAKWDLEKVLQEHRKELFYFEFKEQVTKQLMDKTIEGLRRCAELKLQ
ncbi:hypothetical protein [Succinatimonas hippei]|uniref:hypothetical protein n=1 Tax=Succinatimonas hippei TaxID=626938 RepID=UPI00249316C9|nr:hypothetical protein [Succinatimonas hippei]